LWLHRAETHDSWATLPVSADVQTTTFFNASIQMIMGDGKSLLFWSDPWLQGQHLADLAPDLLAAVPAHRRKQRSVVAALHGDTWIRDITRALTIPLIMQYLDIKQHLQQVQTSPDTLDSFACRWTSTDKYSCSSSYKALFKDQVSILGFKQLWKIRAPSKC
jgi:hypothetical protein